ncbi:ABC transporter permease [Konateibacter massiliensis]|uniref:ABC transporter permease n=1 Tax=Konateibacter massiliensis TaxID=2002841 RepID=UPI000C1504B4|nr:ABC transporter permease [Konateibacter massiliensis]
MQVFKAFMKIFRQTLPGLSMYVIIFLALSFFLSSAGSKTEVSEFSKSKESIAVINEDTGRLGGELKTYLGTIHNVKDLGNDEEVLQDALYYRNVKYILFIPKDFTSKIAAGEIKELCETVKLPASYSGMYIDLQVEQYINTLAAYAGAGIDEKEAAMLTQDDLSYESKINFLNEGTSVEKTPEYFYFRYLAYIFICVVIMGLGPIFMVFHTKEIDDRNLCSALPLRKRNAQIILGSFMVVFLIFLLFMIMAFTLYGKYIDFGKALVYIENCIVFLLIATGLGYMVSIFTSNQNVLNMVTNVLGLGMSFLGGIFVSRELLGDTIVSFSRFLPTYWYINAIEKIQDGINNPSVMNEIQKSIGIQLLFAVAIFAIALAGTKLKAEGKK